VRALCGLWPIEGSAAAAAQHALADNLRPGSIAWPEPRVRLLVLPQRPFMPAGSLAELVTWPADPPQDADALAATVLPLLADVGLEALRACLLPGARGIELLTHLVGPAERLGGLGRRVARWQEFLSPGEQQRAAFARLLFHARYPQRCLQRDAADEPCDTEHDSRHPLPCCGRRRGGPERWADSAGDDELGLLTEARADAEPLVDAALAALPVLALLDEAEAAVDVAGARQLLAAAARVATLVVISHRADSVPDGSVGLRLSGGGRWVSELP
jgi:ABC-type uncharacterized transport system fused permease/ATPase subunit